LITLDLDWMDLELAFRDTTDTESYIDTNTGELVSVLPGFPDEAELRDMIQLADDQYVRISPVNTDFSKAVLLQFIKQISGHAILKKLDAEEAGVGSYAKSIQILRQDKEVLQLYYRFEQDSLWSHIMEALGSAGLEAATPPPEPELFEEAVPAAA
jgi:hypothetical protein